MNVRAKLVFQQLTDPVSTSLPSTGKNLVLKLCGCIFKFHNLNFGKFNRGNISLISSLLNIGYTEI